MAGPYGQFTGYQPLPDMPGAYNFSLANGGQRTFVGPEAEALRAKIDAAPDQRTAGLDWKQAALGAAGTFLPGVGLASLAASDADAKGKADVPVRAAAPAQVAAPLPVAAQQAAAAPAQAQGAPPSGPMRIRTKDGYAELRPGGNPQDPSHWEEVVSARAGTKGGLVMKGQTISDAEKLDPGKLSAIGGVSSEERDARNESALRVEAIAKQRQELMAADQRAAELQANVQFHENAVKTKELDKIRAQYDDAKREYADMPSAQAEREKAGNSGLSGLARALSVSLGALGAGMARTPNFAAEALELDAQRRMRRDEAELRVKKDSVNLLGDLKDKLGGSLDVAKAAYMAIDAKKTAMGYEMLASKEQDQAKAENLRQLARQEWKGHLKWDEEVTRRAEGKISRSFAMQQASAGTAGGRRPLSVEQLAGIAGVTQTYASTNKTLADTAATKAQADSLKPVPAERTTQIAEDASLLALGSRVLTNEVAQGDSDTFEATGSIRSKVPLIGSAIAPKAYKQYEQDTQNWVNRRIKFLTGAGMAETEAIRIARGEVGENMAVNRVRQGVQAGMGEAATRLKANFSTLPPEQQQQLFKKLPPNVQEMLRKGPGEE